MRDAFKQERAGQQRRLAAEVERGVVARRRPGAKVLKVNEAAAATVHPPQQACARGENGWLSGL